MQGMMTRSKRLSPVVKLAETKEKNAALVMAKARKSLKYYEDKLTELQKFRKEYANSMKGTQSGSITASQLQESQRFLRQLDDGISVLTEKITGQKQLSQRDQLQWLMAKKRTDALDKLVVKLKGIEKNIIHIREENEIDERSQHRKIEI